MRFDIGWSIVGTVFPILFTLAFFIIAGGIIVMVVKGVGEWHSNNQSPRLTVSAVLLTKRTHTQAHHHHHGAGGTAGIHGTGGHTTHSTSYYATFQVESGDRMEFLVSGTEYGILVEGDQGMLHFQGTRYLGFDRVY